MHWRPLMIWSKFGLCDLIVLYHRGQVAYMWYLGQAWFSSQTKISTSNLEWKLNLVSESFEFEVTILDIQVTGTIKTICCFPDIVYKIVPKLLIQIGWNVCREDQSNNKNHHPLYKPVPSLGQMLETRTIPAYTTKPKPTIRFSWNLMGSCIDSHRWAG